MHSTTTGISTEDALSAGCFSAGRHARLLAASRRTLLPTFAQKKPAANKPDKADGAEPDDDVKEAMDTMKRKGINKQVARKVRQPSACCLCAECFCGVGLGLWSHSQVSLSGCAGAQSMEGR